MWAEILNCLVEEIYDSPINILCFKIAPGFIPSDTIQSCIFRSVLIIAILIFYLDYKPIPAGVLCGFILDDRNEIYLIF